MTNQPSTGHNNPPTPFDDIKNTIDDLYNEAKNFIDGEPIQTKGQAEAVSKIIDALRKVKTKADELRKEENKEFDEGKKKVQEKYAGLISDTKSKKGKAILALDLCKQAMAPWLQKLEDERQAKLKEEREAADRARRESQEAMAKRSESIEAAEDAEAKAEKAKKAEAQAKRTANTRTNVSGGARAVGMRKVFKPILSNGSEAAAHYWKHNRKEMEDFLLELAKKEVRAGKRSIPGFEIKEETVAR